MNAHLSDKVDTPAGLIRSLLSDATAFYGKKLRSSLSAVDYLRTRGIGGGAAAQFWLGYAPSRWQGLSKVLSIYDEPVVQASGLVVSLNDDAGARKFDRFRDKVMFPIRDLSGFVVGFGGRVLDDSDPKYTNSPEGELFKKRELLYGLFEAQASIRAEGFALVVEGYFDVITLAQAGFSSVVATLGTALSTSHIKLLLSLTPQIVFCFDGDSAGRRAAEHALSAVLPFASDSCKFRFLFLPTEHDPDSYVRASGLDQFLSLLKGSLSLSDFAVSLASEGCDLREIEGRSRFVSQMGRFWSICPDGDVRISFLGFAESVSGLACDALMDIWSGSQFIGACRSLR